jgi:succinylglutamate desuccinylase
MELANKLRLLLVYLIACEAYSASPIRSVAIIGGTHGDEYTGVWCIKHLDANPALLTQYTTLDVQTLLGNPKAHLQNRRFVDDDLNRQFAGDKLAADHDGSHEALRAREIDALLGPKLGSPKTDLVIDLHSTTSNMGITLIVPESDVLMTQAAAYVLWKCGTLYGDHTQILMHPLPDRHARPNLGSTANHALTIEVGPVPQGVLRHDAVEKTQHAMHALLEFLDRRNRGEDVVSELQKVYSDGCVPCYRSAQAEREGEMSGKISWPSMDSNPNFPAVLVHKSIQDRDFAIIRTGDPLFVRLDGSLVRYDGSHGDEVHLIFVNEGGYYFEQSGTGIGVAVKTGYGLMTGLFLKDDCPSYKSFGEL